MTTRQRRPNGEPWGPPGCVRCTSSSGSCAVEHDVELVAGFTSRTYVLDFGRMIIDGPTHYLLGSDEARAAYMGDLDLEAAQ